MNLKLILQAMAFPSVMLFAASHETLAGSSQQSGSNLFTSGADIGECDVKGSVSYDPSRQEYRLKGSGSNIWFGSDQFYYAWRELEGDFILQADIMFEGEGGNPHRKAGWMVRQDTSPQSPHVSATVHGDGLTSLQYRSSQGADMSERKVSLTSPGVIQLERRGDLFIFSSARKGQPFDTVMMTACFLGKKVSAGLFVCSHDNSVIESVLFSNVRIIRPAAAGFVPYRDYIGSLLEVIDISTGSRKILYESPVSIQAPNWTPDGRYLIYNSEGALFRFDLAGATAEKLNSGFATANNNDHVLSFDGSMLGISHHSADAGGKSIVYIMPVTGGTPRQITPEGPSYLHGWSPDGKYLIYTAERGDGNYDIYRIGTDDRKEARLTDAPGLDDGSEYSPDGRYIFFNSVRSGRMQIWRMDADGSNQLQVTNDIYNNWFPHISPDGRKIVFLSYMPDEKPDDHPFYRHVYIRMMNIDGTEPVILAYLYGGQGTMNVPNWSPDGRSVAFVSNTGHID